jgi:hypothetical protein
MTKKIQIGERTKISTCTNLNFKNPKKKKILKSFTGHVCVVGVSISMVIFEITV